MQTPPAPSDAPRVPVGATTVWVLGLLVALEFGLHHLGGFGAWVVTLRSARYGWTMLPRQHARSRDLSVVEDINALGFRDREWDEPRTDASGSFVRDPDLFRVAVLGNSFTYGTSVAIEDTFCRRLEALLADEFGRRGVTRRPLVMDFGVQGYRLAQMARVHADVVRPFLPDLVLVVCHVADAIPLGPTVDEPRYDFRDVVVRSAIHDLLARHVMNVWIPPPEPGVPPELASLGLTWPELEGEMQRRPFGREFEGFWRQAGELMDALAASVLADGGRLVLVGVPRSDRPLHPERRDALSFWRPLVERHGLAADVVDAWPRFEREMEPVVRALEADGAVRAEAGDLDALAWTDALGARRTFAEHPAATRSLHLPDDPGHLSPRGHAVMAEEILAGLVADDLLPRADDAHATRAWLDAIGVDPLADDAPLRLAQRWNELLARDPDEGAREIGRVLALGAPPALVELGWYWKVQVAVAGGDEARIEGAVADYRRVFPDSAKVPRMLALLAERALGRPAKARALCVDLVAAYPGSPQADVARRRIRRIDALGTRPELAFDDLRSGRRATLAELRGRPVVLYAWDSRVAPSDDDLARLAAAERGRAAVVALDLRDDLADGQAARAALGALPAARRPPGLPGYVGGGLDDGFAALLGLEALPAALVLDRDGRLVDADARERLGRVLDACLDER